MKIKNYVKKLGLAAGSIGIIEGIIWSVLAILGIFARFIDLTNPPKEFTHSKTLSITLAGAIQEADIYPLNGTALFIIIIAYLVISLIWLGVSVMLILGIRRNQKNQVKAAMVCWGAMTTIICIFDVVVVGLLAATYATYLESYNKLPDLGLMYALLAYGTLFSLAARGYILWVINLVMAIFVFINVRKGVSPKKNDNDISNMIDAFDDRRRRTSGYINQAFSNNEKFVRSGYNNISRTPSLSNFRASSPTTSVPKPRVATLGNQGVRNNPQPVPPPKPPTKYIYPPPLGIPIPQPDYSPPPQLKSALKSTSPPPPPFPSQRRSDYRY